MGQNRNDYVPFSCKYSYSTAKNRAIIVNDDTLSNLLILGSIFSKCFILLNININSFDGTSSQNSSAPQNQAFTFQRY